ncbi:DNA adenine methylase [Pseudomonas syringae pv. broussonetiae]|uniref:DNA adenine methylase n=1 Tax=Pseudomonas savastanoi TaxID=29438 RepID=A0A3M5B861_PSESS|nr:site-specific DNA-methyltransferase [Pseudomonas savastanoi]KPW49784.1 DNA adenine methylase [Pseudomonas syringae pv. broussonetiae]RMS21459.1 DNA adenine methylase [Pseudomonas savastanoi]RMT26617.1 DNA adenine methylase [Pseudomonas savastanoi]
MEYDNLFRPFSAGHIFTDAWHFPPVKSYCGKHPCEKPLGVLEHIIKTSSLNGDLVLDAFMGSGTTGVACVNTGRKFIGIEMDEKYFQIAKNRIDEAKI